MISGNLTRRYARALLDIGREEKSLSRTLAEVESFVGVCDAAPRLRETLSAKQIGRDEKQKALEAVLATSGFLPTTRNFLLLLVDKDRFDVLPGILVAFRRMVEEAEGIERVEVVVPSPLSAAQKEELSLALAKKTGKKIVIEEKTDPALIGGMVVQIGSVVYDGSLRTQIRQIREKLQKG